MRINQTKGRFNVSDAVCHMLLNHLCMAGKVLQTLEFQPHAGAIYFVKTPFQKRIFLIVTSGLNTFKNHLIPR